MLECACGTGLLTGAIAKRCRTLLATDFSANMLKRAKKKYGALPNVTFRQADILHLDEPDGQFDVVIAANVGDRVLFVDGGQILEQGTPDEVFNHPKEKRTQDFLSKVL